MSNFLDAPVLSAWYHLTLVMTNTDPVTYVNASWVFYVNGVQVASLATAK